MRGLSSRTHLCRAAAIWLLVSACSQESPTDAANIRTAITAANATFTRAVRTNEPELLHGHFDGEILQSLSESIVRAQARGTYAESQLVDLEWGDIRIDDSVATASTTEAWQHTHFDAKSRKCAFRIPARSVKQTFHLQRRGERWVIVRIVDDPANPRAERLPC
jgi:hypothetical protein